jgi:hypothetical protein
VLATGARPLGGGAYYLDYWGGGGLTTCAGAPRPVRHARCASRTPRHERSTLPCGKQHHKKQAPPPACFFFFSPASLLLVAYSRPNSPPLVVGNSPQNIF